MNCKFKINEDGYVFCEQCGFKYKLPKSINVDLSKIFRECTVIKPEIQSEKDNKVVYPSIIQQISNAVKSVKDFVVSGGKTSTKEEIDKRLEICRSCEFYDEKQNRCSKCGCYLALKSRLESDHCPMGKW